MTNVKKYVLRYWETEFKIKSRKNRAEIEDIKKTFK